MTHGQTGSTIQRSYRRMTNQVSTWQAKLDIADNPARVSEDATSMLRRCYRKLLPWNLSYLLATGTCIHTTKKSHVCFYSPVTAATEHQRPCGRYSTYTSDASYATG